jgi:cyclase
MKSQLSLRLRIALIAIFFCVPALIRASEYGKVTMSKVADGVYLFRTTPYGDVGLGGNAVAILGEDGVVLFDTSGTPASGEAIVSGIRMLTDKPVLYVVNSHWHWDHWGGNQAVKAAYPNVRFLSHEKNRDLMMNVAIPWNAPGLEKGLPDYLEMLRKNLAKAEAAHAPKPDLVKMREILAADEDFLGQKRSVVYTFPNETFSDAVTLFLGGREIRVLHARAITPGDTYIYLPKEKILISGDILVNPVPFAIGGSYPQDWIKTLQKLEAMEIETIIPGHGDVEHDKNYLHQNLKLFQHVLADVKDSKAKGMTLEQTKAALLKQAANYAADIALPDARIPEFKSYFLEVFVNRAYHELAKPLGDEPTS